MSIQLEYTSRGGDFLGRAETICLRDTNREPDKTEEEIQQ